MYYIGIDLGGTNIAAGIVTEEGKIVVKDSVPTLSERPTDEIVTDMANLSKKLVQSIGIEMNEIKGIGIGCPGTIDFETGEIVYSNNIKINHYPLDANCAALGEYKINRHCASVFALVTLGTGVGGGVIINGKVFRGFNGAAGELGHMTIVSGGKMCTCGKEGCLESYASATALISQTKDALETHKDTIMHGIVKKEGKISGRTAFEAAKQGDEVAKKVVSNYERYLADGIVSIENIFQPEIIAIGGGISKEGDYLIEPIREYVYNTGFNKHMTKTKIVAAQLFNDAGIIGAAMLAI